MKSVLLLTCTALLVATSSGQTLYKHDLSAIVPMGYGSGRSYTLTNSYRPTNTQGSDLRVRSLAQRFAKPISIGPYGESSSYHRPSSGGDGEQTSYGATPSYSPVSNYNPYSSSRSSSGGGGYSGRGVTYRSRDGSYASQPSYSSSQSYQAPATTYEASVPTYQAPAPTYQRPAPTYQPSPPTYQESVPTYEAPAPRYETATYEAPAPVYLDVQPSYGQQQQQQQHNGYTKSPEYFTTTKYGPIESGALRGQGQKSSAVEFARQGQASGTLYSADTAEAAEAAKKSRGYEYRYREGHHYTQPKTLYNYDITEPIWGYKDQDGYGQSQHGGTGYQ